MTEISKVHKGSCIIYRYLPRYLSISCISSLLHLTGLFHLASITFRYVAFNSSTPLSHPKFSTPHLVELVSSSTGEDITPLSSAKGGCSSIVSLLAMCSYGGGSLRPSTAIGLLASASGFFRLERTTMKAHATAQRPAKPKPTPMPTPVEIPPVLVDEEASAFESLGTVWEEMTVLVHRLSSV